MLLVRFSCLRYKRINCSQALRLLIIHSQDILLISKVINRNFDLLFCQAIEGQPAFLGAGYIFLALQLHDFSLQTNIMPRFKSTCGKAPRILPTSDIAAPASKKLCLASKQPDDPSQYLFDGKYADVKVVMQDNFEVWVHSVFICTNCLYLEKILQSSFKVSEKRIFLAKL
jgi:hypothetical protein